MVTKEQYDGDVKVRTVSEIASAYGVYRVHITKWKKQALEEELPRVFSRW